MRQIVSALVLIACSVTVFAQSTPKAEIFGGLTYANYELLSVARSSSSSTFTTGSFTTGSLTTMNPSARLGLLGWNGAATVDINRWFGFTTDFSGNYSNSSTSITQTYAIACGTNCATTETIKHIASQPRIHSFLFGPQFSYSSGKLRPFAHYLIGGSRKSITQQEVITLTSSTGAIIIPAFPLLLSSSSENLFAMAFGGGVDYPIRKKLACRFAADYLTNQGTNQNHVRATTGLVWQVGK
jgi:hypothetical protein